MLAPLRSLGRMIFRRPRWERETNDEIQLHIEQRAERLARSGMAPEEARRRARLEFGGVEGYTGLREPHKELLYSPLPADGVAAIVARAKPGVAVSAAQAEVRSALAAAFPGVPVETGHLEEAVQRSLGRDRLVAQLSAAFGFLGVVLASIGLYGAMAHAVTSRTREIGIRIAVGAGAWDVIRMVLKQSLRVTGLGILIGLPAAIAASRLIASLLFEVSPSDPLTLAVSAAVLGTAGLAAGWWPARRAARLDPSQTLRCE